MNKKLTREELLREIEAKIFNSTGAPLLLQFDDLKPFREQLNAKNNEDLEKILVRVRDWEWKKVHAKLITACINNEPFFPLEN